MAWYLNPFLTAWRFAINTTYPIRDKSSDGTIGDVSHQGTNSDHNPDVDGSVDAFDMDVNLGTSNDAAEIEHLKSVFQRQSGARYWIHNDQIAHKNENWQRKSYAYAGPNRNRHTQHVHWNSDQAHETNGSVIVIYPPPPVIVPELMYVPAAIIATL